MSDGTHSPFCPLSDPCYDYAIWVGDGPAPHNPALSDRLGVQVCDSCGYVCCCDRLAAAVRAAQSTEAQNGERRKALYESCMSIITREDGSHTGGMSDQDAQWIVRTLISHIQSEERFHQRDQAKAAARAASKPVPLTAILDAVAAVPTYTRRSNNDGMGGQMVNMTTGENVPVEARPETFTELVNRAHVVAAIEALFRPEGES